MVRTFIAIGLPGEIREGLARAQVSLKHSGAKVSWVRPENIHLTMAFLGDVLGKRLPKLAARLDEVTATQAPFAVEVAGLGFFGSPQSPRVIWAGVQVPYAPLAALHEAVQAVLESLGFEVERGRFRPHLTLGRVRARQGVGELTARLGSDKTMCFGGLAVERLLLMMSTLDPRGARYSVLHASVLKGVTSNGHEIV